MHGMRNVFIVMFALFANRMSMVESIVLFSRLLQVLFLLLPLLLLLAISLLHPRLFLSFLLLLPMLLHLISHQYQVQHIHILFLPLLDLLPISSSSNNNRLLIQSLVQLFSILQQEELEDPILLLPLLLLFRTTRHHSNNSNRTNRFPARIPLPILLHLLGPLVCPLLLLPTFLILLISCFLSDSFGVDT